MKAASRSLIVSALLASMGAVTGGCRQANDFLPRTHTTSTSPDGRHQAYVRQGLNIDPPDDHLFLTTRGGSTRALMDLPPDADWCRTIIWTPDSRKVGFVVSDDRVALFDVETGALDAFFFLVGQGCCGGPQEARHVALNSTATEVSFDRYDRQPVRNLGREVVRIPVSRVRLRLVPAEGRSLPQRIAVKVVAPSGRWIDVPGTPAADGLVVLPAVDDGPIDRLEIHFLDGTGKRTIVRGVRTGEPAVVVSVPPSA